jgi:hypothetical protein
MNFSDVDQKYEALKLQYQAGALTAAQFDDQLRALMIQDSQGRWWAKARETGDWNYYDNATTTWVAADPYAAARPPAPPPSSQAGPASTTPAAGQSGGAQPAQIQPTAAQPAQPYQAGGVPAAAQPYGGYAEGYGAAQPELGSGLKVVFYILSFLVPIVGIVLFFVYRNKPTQADRSAARLFLILGIVSFLLSCMCSLGYAALIPTMLGGNF